MDWNLAVMTLAVVAGWLIGKAIGLVTDLICKWQGIDNKSYWKEQDEANDISEKR